MRDISERWSRLPAYVRWPVGIALTVAIYTVAYVAVASVTGLDDSAWVQVVVVVVAIPLVALGTLQQQRRLGGRGQLGLYRQAYRSGTVPAGADVERWRPLVRRHARYFREGRRVQAGWFALMGVALVVGATVGIVGDPDRLTTGLGVAIVTLLVVIVVAAVGIDRVWRRREQQFTRLHRALTSSP